MAMTGISEQSVFNGVVSPRNCPKSATQIKRPRKFSVPKSKGDVLGIGVIRSGLSSITSRIPIACNANS